MGQRGLLTLEKTSTQLLWSSLWNLNKRNIATIDLNTHLYNLYIFYFFLYETTTAMAMKVFGRPALNSKSRTRLKNISDAFHSSCMPVIHHIMRYYGWILIVIFYCKFLVSKPLLARRTGARTTYFALFSNLR